MDVSTQRPGRLQPQLSGHDQLVVVDRQLEHAVEDEPGAALPTVVLNRSTNRLR